MSDNTGFFTIKLDGRIDSGNAAETEKEIFSKLERCASSSVTIDAEGLEYISSAGLRMILRLKKTYPDLKIVNVNPEIYEILDMTGFTEMMAVEKAYRVVSVEGCEVIGEGFNGKVYRIDRDNVVKTYKNADALSEIQHEREVARLALILGVPTAISYDVVKVGDSYGSVFELLNARSFAKILANDPDRYDFCVDEYVKMLKKIHGITVPEGKLPSIKDKYIRAISRIKDKLPDGLGEKLYEMACAIPESDKMIHGDYHTKNIVLAGDEVLLIDMDTLSVGNPVFELAQMYNSYVGFSEYDPSIILNFQGYDAATARKFWHDTLSEYLGTKDEAKIKAAEDKIRCLSYSYLIDWKMRHEKIGIDSDDPTFSLWKNNLLELLRRVDSLDFDAGSYEGGKGELDIEATVENLETVIDYVNDRLDAASCPPKACMHIDLAVEEIFINIANYAYAPETGKVSVRVEVSDDPVTVILTFIDHGVPYDPLAKEDPDVTLSAEERQVGGLGVFITKKLMDDVEYKYLDGQNILTLKKEIK